MDRKIALAAAAAVVLTVSAGTAAIAANLGLLSATADDTVGQLQPARADGSPTQTIVIEEIVPTEEPLPATGPSADDGRYEDDDRYEYEDDDDYDDEEDDDDGYEEHEGEDDDGHDDDD